MLDISEDVIEVIQKLKKKLRRGGKSIFLRNGCSAADTQHLAAEFLVRLRPHIKETPLLF